MSKWRVVGTATFSREFFVEADDESEARNKGIEAAFEEWPLADEYDTIFEPQPVTE